MRLTPARWPRETSAMDAALLRKILSQSPAFRLEGERFVVEEGFDAVVHVSCEAHEASLERVRGIAVHDGLVTVTSSAEGRTTTYLEPSSVVSVAVREDLRGERKRPGFL